MVSALCCIALLAIGADPAAASAASSSAEPDAHLIDMVVAQVDAQVITLSELVAETRLFLLRNAGPEVARAGKLSPELLKTVLKTIVSRELLLGEARLLRLPEPPDADVKKSLEAIRSRFASPADYQRFLERTGLIEPGVELVRGLDAPPQLVAIVLAELEVQRFLDVRIRRNVVVRDSDIALCFEANRARFEGRKLEDVKSAIKDRIEEQQQRRALDARLAQLEQRATVRYTTGFETERAPAEDLLSLVCPDAH